MDKDFIPKFSDIENDYRERLKNDVSKYLPKKEKEVEKPKEVNSHPEEIKNSNLPWNNLDSSGYDHEEKFTKNQKLTLALICAVFLCAGVLYYLGINNYFKATYTDNSTCVANNITIPKSPDCNCPVNTCSLTCPAQIINITISNHS